MSESLLVVRGSIVGAVVLTGVLFLPALADPVNVVKLTVLVIAALVIISIGVFRVVTRRILTLPVGAAAWAAASLGVALVISAALAPNTTTAVVGTYGRNSGLMAYGAALVLYFAGLRAWTASTAHVLALGLLAAGLFTASYGLLQYAGIDAIHWNNPFSPIIASLGNPDFASAYLGICVPVAAWGAGWRRWTLPWRAASALTGFMCLLAAILSHAIQGSLGACAGLAIFAVALLLERGGAAARRGLLALGIVAFVSLCALIAGAVKLGPAAPVFRRGSFQARQYYWDGAVAMLRRRPVIGVGLDHYGAYWRQVRSDSATRQLGPSSFSDAAHSVPLQMFAQGGILLGATYAVFVLLVAGALVRGLLRLAGPPRLLLAGIGGAWAAYVVSSIVSIDQVPLLTVEFATAGAVVALAGAGSAALRLPGAPAIAQVRTTRRGRKAPVRRFRSLGAPDFLILGVAGTALAVLAWFSLLPFRANAAAHTGDVALASGQGNEALAAYRRATRLLPGVGIYWEKAGSLLESVEHPELALPVYRQGARRDDLDLALLQNAARLAADSHLVPEARTLWRRAAELDPNNPKVITGAANFETANGNPEKALSLLAHPLALLPQDPSLWVAAGAARAGAGDNSGALRAFSKALALDPTNPGAKAGLAELGAGVAS